MKIERSHQQLNLKCLKKTSQQGANLHAELFCQWPKEKKMHPHPLPEEKGKEWEKREERQRPRERCKITKHRFYKQMKVCF